MNKVDYVLSQEQTRSHHCHWPGCETQVPPAMWGCKPHWFKLPKDIRNKIWKTYRPGQETNMTPSAEYVEAAREAQNWIRQNFFPAKPVCGTCGTEQTGSGQCTKTADDVFCALLFCPKCKIKTWSKPFKPL